MPKSSSKPRIGDTSPSDFARRAVQIASARTTLARPSNPSDVQLGRDAEAVAAFALCLPGAPDAASVGEVLERVSCALYGSAEPPADLNSSACVVLLAARARLSVARGSPVTTSELAAAAGMDPASVRRLIRLGSLSRSGRDIGPESAASLLASRPAAAGTNETMPG